MENSAGEVQPVRTPRQAASIDPSISKAWARARAGLRSEFGEEAFRSWINPLTLEAVRGNTAILSIKSRFLRDWVSSNYRPQILGHFNAELPAIEAVDLVAKIAAPEAGALPGPRRPGGRNPHRGSHTGERSRQHAQPAAGAALHLRQFRRRQAERTGLRRRPAGRRFGRHPLQPAVHPRRRRPRQDPSDARHGLAHPGTHALAPRRLHLGREIHVPVRPGAALQGYAGLQGAVPLRRRADDRRRPVHGRQGRDPGGVLPHLQRADGRAPPGRRVGRQVAERTVRHRGAADLPLQLGPGRGRASDDLRAAAQHPAGQGREDGLRLPGTRSSNSSPTRSSRMCANWRAR